MSNGRGWKQAAWLWPGSLCGTWPLTSDSASGVVGHLQFEQASSILQKWPEGRKPPCTLMPFIPHALQLITPSSANPNLSNHGGLSTSSMFWLDLPSP